jgi:putative cardiolipin synthase
MTIVQVATVIWLVSPLPAGAAEPTGLGQQVNDLVASAPEGAGGFFLLRDGVDSLAMRLQLIRRAERSVDIQVYEFYFEETTGGVLVHRLLEAADRGVRVRLLLDDISTAGDDAGLVGLDSHPSIDVRIFNPFQRGVAGRARSLATKFGKVNRRMHNKNFIVDGRVLVSGGRNIGDKYFNALEEARFSDLDIFAIGSVVADAEAMFEEYWNHETAQQLQAFAKMPDDPAAELDRIRRNFTAVHEQATTTRYADAIRARQTEFFDLDPEKLIWSPYRLVYDSPDKGIQSRKDQAELMRTPLIEVLETAQSELIVLTPFFVPRKSGVDWFSELEQRGVEVTIVTNSLASQSQIVVHGGYSASRKQLLKSGVELHEFRPDVPVSDGPTESEGKVVTLHTKAFLIDREIIVVGSFNVDPRSNYINTESGYIIESPELARQFVEAVDAALMHRTYEVFFNDQGNLRWRTIENGDEVVLKSEPQATAGRRFSAQVSKLLPIRGQL